MSEKKGKVYDMFTRKDIDEERQDTSTNDNLANDFGKYVGALEKEHSDTIRTNLQRLQAWQEQIDAMINEWEKAYEKHQLTVLGALKKLKVSPNDFDPGIHDVFISEDGHVWLVEREKMKTKGKLH